MNRSDKRSDVGIAARVWRTRPPVVAIIVLAALVLIAVLAPVISPYPPNLIDLVQRLKPPAFAPAGTAAHFLGTDSLGRDLLTELMYGARISLLVGFASVGVGASVGVVVGLITGYTGGRIDNVVMRIADIQLAFPFILLAIALIAVLGPGVVNVVVVLALRSWVEFARLVRGEVLRLKYLEFVDAARAIGAPASRVMFWHLLPNALAPAIVLVSFAVAHAIIAEASLSFLGFGPGAAIPTWGATLANGRVYLSSAWWIALFPGLAIMATVLSINLLGDWLRDALDPRLRGS